MIWLRLAALPVFAILALTLAAPRVLADSVKQDDSAQTDYILRATSQERGISDTNSYARWGKKEITYFTIEPSSVDERLVQIDLRVVMDTAAIPRIKVAWCQIKFATGPFALPECALKNTADVVVAYLKSEADAPVIQAVLRNLHFNSEIAASKVQRDSTAAMANAQRGYCLGTVARQEDTLEASFLLTDVSGSLRHVRCTAFFSYASMGVVPAPLKEWIDGEHDALDAAREIGANPTTALKFLYSTYVEAGMSWSQYTGALKSWLQSNSAE